MKRVIALTAILSSALTILAVWGFSWAALPSQVKLENPKVKVTEISAPPGVPRTRHIRERDQVIVFLDDCRYERTDSKTGAKGIQTRRAGDVIWHSRGEDAPQLINLGSQPYRTLVIELK